MHNFALVYTTLLPMRHILLFLLSAVVVMACSGGDKGEKAPAGDAEREADSLVLKVGVIPTMDCLPLFVADERGIFDSLNVNIRLVCYDDGLECCTDLMRGDIQCCVTDIVRAEWMKSKGCALRYVTSTDAYWQFITNRKARINELRQMTDKMLAVTRCSAEDMLGDIAVDSAKIDAEYVFRIQINNPSLRLRMIRNNEMDAAMLTEPQAAVARADNDTVLMDSRDKGLRLGAIVARNDHTINDSTLIEAYNRAVAVINADGIAAYSHIITNRMHVDETVVPQLKDITFSPASQPREQDIARAKEWLNTK